MVLCRMSRTRTARNIFMRNWVPWGMILNVVLGHVVRVGISQLEMMNHFVVIVRGHEMAFKVSPPAARKAFLKKPVLIGNKQL